jgi:hypothetical protein
MNQAYWLTLFCQVAVIKYKTLTFLIKILFFFVLFLFFAEIFFGRASPRYLSAENRQIKSCQQ